MEAANIHFNLPRNRPDCKRFPGDLLAGKSTCSRYDGKHVL
jgi:hypothetical protein